MTSNMHGQAERPSPKTIEGRLFLWALWLRNKGNSFAEVYKRAMEVVSRFDSPPSEDVVQRILRQAFECEPADTNGYCIRIDRRLRTHPLWTGERFGKGQAFMDLLLRANPCDSMVLRGSIQIEVKQGQVFTSQKELAEAWRWDRKTVRRFLEALKKNNMVDIETSKETDTGYTLLTIFNYSQYQAHDMESRGSPKTI